MKIFTLLVKHVHSHFYTFSLSLIHFHTYSFFLYLELGGLALRLCHWRHSCELAQIREGVPSARSQPLLSDLQALSLHTDDFCLECGGCPLPVCAVLPNPVVLCHFFFPCRVCLEASLSRQRPQQS